MLSVAGKVSSIDNGGTAFTLELTAGDRKSMNFLVDKNTTIKGKVRQGSAVTANTKPWKTGKIWRFRLQLRPEHNAKSPQFGGRKEPLARLSCRSAK